jgi:hypothetical protein
LSGLRDGAALAAGLLTYAVALKLWLLTTGDTLSLGDFVTGDPPPPPADA